MFQSQLREQFPYDTYFMSAVPNLFVITYPGWEPLLNAIIFVTTTFKKFTKDDVSKLSTLLGSNS